MSASKSSFVCLLTLLLILTLCFGVSAEEVAIAWKTAAPPAIDGDLSDWIRESPVYIGEDWQLTKHHEYWSGSYDSSGTFYLMWDEENLYLAGEIADDNPFIRFMAYDIEGNDGLALYLGTDPLSEIGRVLYDPTDFRLLFGFDPEILPTGIDRNNVLFKKGIVTEGLDGYDQVLKGCQYAIEETEVGFTIEIKLPFAALSNEQIPVLKPVVGMEVGFNLELYDLDQACPGSVATGLTWKPGNPKLSPKDWGILRFEE